MPCKTGELTTASDGLPARCVGQWSKDKCYYIGRYAAIFSAGMKDKFPKRDYIDLFAGPGRCVLSDDSGEFDGSPKPSKASSLNWDTPILPPVMKFDSRTVSERNFITSLPRFRVETSKGHEFWKKIQVIDARGQRQMFT
jgi:hypothetical protein